MSEFKHYLLSISILAGTFSISVNAADRIRVVNEGGIRDQWMLADGVKLSAPGYPGAFSQRGDNVCITVGYSIKPDGTTSEFSLLKAWTSSTAEKEPVEGFWDAFAQASADALSKWKFKPRPEVTNPQTTFTVATMHFMGRQATNPAELRGHCTINDLSAFIQKQKSDKFRRGDVLKASMENERRKQGDRSMKENVAQTRAIGR